MAKDTVTLALSGQPTLHDLAAAVAGFSRLISQLVKKNSAAGDIQWRITGLDAGSAIATAQGIPEKTEDNWVVERVVADYHFVGEAAKSGSLRNKYPLTIVKPAEEIMRVIGLRVPSVRFETPDDDVEIYRLAPEHSGKGQIEKPEVPVVNEVGLGAVRGRVQTLTNRGALRFTLYEVSSDHAISCYLKSDVDSENMMRDLWGRLVSVEGLVRRDPRTSLVTTVREITSITSLPVVDPDSYREGRGILRRTDIHELPEAAVRRIRNG